MAQSVSIERISAPESTPRISVVLPVYNAGPFLCESIESILQQTERDFELLIVNDHSTDNSEEIIRQYLTKDDRIVYLKHPANLGVSASRNSALEQAKGSMIALMDADDICSPDRFRKQIEYMNTHNLDVCGSYLKEFGEKSRNVSYPLDDTIIRLNLLCYGRSIANPSAMLRKETVGHLRYNTRFNFGEDYEFWINAALNTPARFGNVPEQLVQYRKHGFQASQHLNHKNRKVMTEVLLDALKGSSISPDHSTIELHYKLLKEKYGLQTQDINRYRTFLLQVLHALDLSATETSDYWYQYCNKRLKRNLNTWKLYRSICQKQAPSSFAAQLRLLVNSIIF